MRFSNDGISLWSGTLDAPAPKDSAPAGKKISLTLAVQPTDASNRVSVLCRVNGGDVATVAAKWFRNDTFRDVQYFQANLPTFRVGDSVEWIAICHCAGRQVPSTEDAKSFVAAFQVTDPAESSFLRAHSDSLGEENAHQVYTPRH